MQNISTDPILQKLWERTHHHAIAMGRTLPEMRFFILDSMEFASLLEKNVYPTSPVNIWEGKSMVTKKNSIENGQESSIYYEVVQTGNPSYAYLNHTNSTMMQASVMAHVVGHCEFSELNVLHDSDYTTFYILGNSITRSSAIDYNTDQSDDSKNKESVIFDSSWIQNEQDAEKLANWIKSNSLNKGRFVDMTVFGNPILSAGDIVSINYPILGMTQSSNKYVITKCTLDYKEGVNTTISCRAI